MIWLLTGLLSARTARKRGRHPRRWFALGILLGIFAVLILYALPTKKVPVICETSATPVSNKPEPGLSGRLWYYLSATEERIGPVCFEELKEKREKGEISSTTYLWTEGMLDWKRLEELPYLRTELP